MRGKKKIVYVQFTNPCGYPPLEHSSQILAMRGYSVTFLGIESWGGNDLAFPDHPNISVVFMGRSRAGGRGKLHYLSFVAWVILWVLWNRPAVIYASDWFVTPPALLLSWLGCRVVYHEHDAPMRPANLFHKLMLWTRAQLARRVYCVVPSSARAALLARQTGCRDVQVVWNCPRAEEVLSIMSEARIGKPDSEPLTVVYQGTIVPERVPEQFIHAMASEQIRGKIQLVLVGYETVGSEGYIKKLQFLAESLGIGSSVTYRGAMSRFRMLREAHHYDVGLATIPDESDDDNFKSMLGASNKPFDYLAQGLALITTRNPSWDELFVRNGYARAVSPTDAKSIIEALSAFLRSKDQTKAMGLAGQRRIADEWNYDTQFSNAVKYIIEATA